MKRKCFILVWSVCIFFHINSYASSVSLAVPKQLLKEKASLVLFIQDQAGNEQVGKCLLDEELAHRKIVEQDLQIMDETHFDNAVDSVEINTTVASEGEVLLHFEFDTDLRVIRVLIIKDCLLEDNPFDIFTIPVEQNEASHDLDSFDSDEYSDLIDDVDIEAVTRSVKSVELSMFEKCKLYAQVYAFIKYHELKRYVSEKTSWFYE